MRRRLDLSASTQRKADGGGVTRLEALGGLLRSMASEEVGAEALVRLVADAGITVCFANPGPPALHVVASAAVLSAGGTARPCFNATVTPRLPGDVVAATINENSWLRVEHSAKAGERPCL